MRSVVLIVCFLIIGTTLGQEQERPRLMKRFLSGISTAAEQGLDLAHSAVKLGTSLTGNAVQSGTNMGKMGVIAAESLSSQALGQGVDIGKQTLELTKTVSSIIPGASMPVGLATGAGKWGLDLGNNIGQKGIKASSDLKQLGLDYGNKMTQLTTGTIENFSNAGTGMTKEAIKTGLNIVGGLFGSSVDAAKEAIPDIGKQINQVVQPKPQPLPIAKPEPPAPKTVAVQKETVVVQEVVTEKPASQGMGSYIKGFFG